MTGRSFTTKTPRHKEGPLEVGFSHPRRFDMTGVRSILLPMDVGFNPALTLVEIW
jgi:hypothetical protein